MRPSPPPFRDKPQLSSLTALNTSDPSVPSRSLESTAGFFRVGELIPGKCYAIGSQASMPRPRRSLNNSLIFLSAR